MAQTLKFGNGTWATKKGSTLAYSDEGGNFKPLPFTYTGPGKGTRVNKQGLIEVVENDRPRIDYTDSEDGVFLLEKQSTNLVTYSEDFSNAYWANTEATTVNTNVAVSPDGASNADKLIPQATSAFHRLSKTFSVTPSTPYVFTAFVKRAGYNYFLIRASDTANNNIGFDLVNGTVTYTASGYSAFIEPYGNDWYRVGFVRSFTASSMTINFRSDSNIVNANNITTFTGNGTSGVYIYGAQLESGNVSSYIPTEGTIQTRVQETASGSGNSEVFNSEQGVLFANIAANADDLTQRALGLSDGTSSNRMSIVYNDGSSNALRMFVSNPSGTKSYITNSFNITQNNKISIKLNGTSLAFWVNGFEIHTDTLNSAFVNGTLDTFDFAFFDNNTPFYGKTKEIAYYDEVLTDLELETLTSFRTWEAMVKELNLNIIHNE